MARYRNNLPQLTGDPFLTGGGLETTLYFIHSIDLMRGLRDEFEGDLPLVVISGCMGSRGDGIGHR